MEMDLLADCQTDSQTERQVGRQTDTDSQPARQIDRQTDGQMERWTERQIDEWRNEYNVFINSFINYFMCKTSDMIPQHPPKAVFLSSRNSTLTIWLTGGASSSLSMRDVTRSSWFPGKMPKWSPGLYPRLSWLFVWSRTKMVERLGERTTLTFIFSCKFIFINLYKQQTTRMTRDDRVMRSSI